jgi:hypothetical protein
MSFLGNIFRDVDFSFDFFERIIGDGPSGFFGGNDAMFDRFGFDFGDIGLQIGIQLGLFGPGLSQDQLDRLQPPADPFAPPVPQILILPDPPPERVTEVMQDWFEFVASNNPTPFDPFDARDFGYTYQGYDAYAFLV